MREYVKLVQSGSAAFALLGDQIGRQSARLVVLGQLQYVCESKNDELNQVDTSLVGQILRL